MVNTFESFFAQTDPKTGDYEIWGVKESGTGMRLFSMDSQSVSAKFAKWVAATLESATRPSGGV